MDQPKLGLNPYDANRLRKLLIESAGRRIEALKLYRPMPWQDAFHKSTASERVVRAGNRTGKSVCIWSELALAVCNQDPYNKWPKSGIFYAVGFDQKFIADPICKMLLKPGSFKIIRDRITGTWRVFNPLEDKDRSKEVVLSPPLIPPRFIDEIAWEDKKAGVPKTVRLTTDWVIHFFTANARPPRGTSIDGCVMDEEVEKDWYAEVRARLLDKSGKFIWGCTPQSGTDVLFDLHERAEAQAMLPPGERTVEEFYASQYDNIYMTQAQKDEFQKGLSEEDIKVRVYGDFAQGQAMALPEYGAGYKFEVPYFDIPSNWTRYLAIDPGFQICAVLFLAVPPPTFGDYVYLYDELYLGKCDAMTFAREMERHCTGQAFESFLIDRHGGKHSSAITGTRVMDIYSQELFKRKIRSQRTGSGFIQANDDAKAGLAACRLWMRERDDGTCKLRVFKDKVPNFIWEVKRFRMKKDGSGKILDVPTDRGRVHQCDNLMYLALYDPQWVKPQDPIEFSPVFEYLRLMEAEEKHQREDGPMVMLG